MFCHTYKAQNYSFIRSFKLENFMWFFKTIVNKKKPDFIQNENLQTEKSGKIICVDNRERE